MHGDKFHQGVPTDHWHKFQNPDIAYMAGLAKATRATMWSGTIRGVSVSVASTASPQTITLPATTLAGDCLVIAASCGGSYTPSGSGAGATWNTVVSSGSSPKAYLVVGWGCTAGNTTCVLTGFANSGSVVLTQFTGVLSSSNPVQGTQVTQWSSATGGTTASLSYTAGSLLIAVSSQYTAVLPLRLSPGVTATPTRMLSMRTTAVGRARSTTPPTHRAPVRHARWRGATQILAVLYSRR